MGNTTICERRPDKAQYSYRLGWELLQDQSVSESVLSGTAGSGYHGKNQNLEEELPGVSPRRARGLLAHIGTPAAVICASPQDFRKRERPGEGQPP